MTDSKLYDEIQELEDEIKGYQEFLGQLQITYDECGPGCTDSFRQARRIDTGFLQKMYGEHGIQDDFIEDAMDSEEMLQGRGVRKITGHCRDILMEKREEREELLEAKKALEEEVAFRRHPKKDVW